MPSSKRPVKVNTDPNRNIRIVAIVMLVVAVIGVLYALVTYLIPLIAAAQANAQKNAGANATASAPTGAGSQKQWSSPPPLSINIKTQYTATVTMAKGGQFAIQLYADKAPMAVNNFVFLTNQHYYDGVTFHRVLPGFMAQGGDPTGTGSGSPGYQFANEQSDLTFDKAGVVAMANAGPDTNGSQFFITYGPQSTLNGNYTIFGQVVSGMDAVNAITPRDPTKNPTFTGDVIQSITITQK